MAGTNSLGAPGVRVLTDKQAEFVTLVERGVDPVEACRQIGYTPADPRKGASELMKAKPVRLALNERYRARIDTQLVTKALNTLDELMQDSTPPATRLGAARTVLDYSALNPKLGPAAPGAVSADKDLADMDLAELQAFVKAGSQALERLRDASQAEPIEAVPVVDSAPSSEQ